MGEACARGYLNAAVIGGAVYVLLVASFFGFKISRWAYRKATGWKHPSVVALELRKAMTGVYRLTAGLVIHPTMLKEEMLKTKEKGAVWDAALYDLVDRIISIDPAVWVIQPSDADEDADGDGFTNLQEFLAGLDPNDPNDAGPSVLAAAVLPGSRSVEVETPATAFAHDHQPSYGDRRR